MTPGGLRQRDVGSSKHWSSNASGATAVSGPCTSMALNYVCKLCGKLCKNTTIAARY